jgi:hypothetical protein
MCSPQNPCGNCAPPAELEDPSDSVSFGQPKTGRGNRKRKRATKSSLARKSTTDSKLAESCQIVSTELKVNSSGLTCTNCVRVGKAATCNASAHYQREKGIKCGNCVEHKRTRHKCELELIFIPGSTPVCRFCHENGHAVICDISSRVRQHLTSSMLEAATPSSRKPARVKNNFEKPAVHLKDLVDAEGLRRILESPSPPAALQGIGVSKAHDIYSVLGASATHKLVVGTDAGTRHSSSSWDIVELGSQDNNDQIPSSKGAPVQINVSDFRLSTQVQGESFASQAL